MMRNPRWIVATHCDELEERERQLDQWSSRELQDRADEIGLVYVHRGIVTPLQPAMIAHFEHDHGLLPEGDLGRRYLRGGNPAQTSAP